MSVSTGNGSAHARNQQNQNVPPRLSARPLPASRTVPDRFAPPQSGSRSVPPLLAPTPTVSDRSEPRTD
ncbi:unnamed protein product [Caenorhabditis sp. 36 PRJEB53466]|nr:unnamed protein product [Caenorhabditis sp. 36 PRJEB53466]